MNINEQLEDGNGSEEEIGFQWKRPSWNAATSHFPTACEPCAFALLMVVHRRKACTIENIQQSAISATITHLNDSMREMHHAGKKRHSEGQLLILACHSRWNADRGMVSVTIAKLGRQSG